MSREWFIRTLQVTVFTITVAAVCQELEKPKEARKWHGKVAGMVPYDFRIPTIERLKESYWNSCESRILTPSAFGIGWAINFYSLLEHLWFFRQAAISEENFLMPTPSIKKILTETLAAEQDALITGQEVEHC